MNHVVQLFFDTKFVFYRSDDCLFILLLIQNGKFFKDRLKKGFYNLIADPNYNGLKQAFQMIILLSVLKLMIEKLSTTSKFEM